MTPLPYTIPDGFIFWIAFFIWLLPEMVGGAKQRASRSRTEAIVQDRGSQAVLLAFLYSGIVLNFVLSPLSPWANITWHPTLLFFSGVALLLLGVALRWYAISTLGRYFTRDVAVSTDQPVVQNGPYRFIRHPAYCGSLLSMAALGLCMTNLVGLVAIIVCNLIGYLYRINVEERALRQIIGQRYIDYMRHTRRIIPFVY